jgi:hypothetical protein
MSHEIYLFERDERLVLLAIQVQRKTVVTVTDLH